MTNDQTIDDLLGRLERERLAADRAYNDALTAVDRALQAETLLPDAPPPYDSSKLSELNAAWDILPGGAPAFDSSIKGRLRALVWRMVGPALEGQQSFNAALVDHLNRNAAAHAAAARAAGAAVETLRRELAALVRFESLLVQYLQTITAYVDTKDRSAGGSEIRERLALTEQRILALKREVEAHGRAAPGQASAAPAGDAFSGAVDALTYVGFEDRYRGTSDEIRRRVDDYVPILAPASDVVDIGCGRGELLAALKDRGVRARGIDMNAAMVALCRSRGLDVDEGDALGFLERQADGTIGGLVAVQVVEHFTPAYLTRFLAAAFHAMRPGAPLVLETINPACWMAFFETYIRDLTHKQPLHPDTLKYLVQAAGFSKVDVQFRAPVAEADRLPHVHEEAANAGQTGGGAGTGAVGQTGLGGAAGREALAAVIAAVNAHADKLNGRLFSSMDYVVVGRR